MKRKLLTVGLFAVLLALPAIVQAANITNFFDYSGKLNEIKYQNFSAFVDSSGNPTAPGVGSFLVSIFRADTLRVEQGLGTGIFGGNPVWRQALGGNGEFFAYSFQEVDTVSATGLIFKNPTASDPFKVLPNGVMAGFFIDTTPWSITGNLANDIADVTDGTPWGYFGLTSNVATKASYTGDATDGVQRANLDAIGALPINISEFDRSRTDGTDIKVRAFVAQLLPSAGQWISFSQDPMTFAVVVPEPATLAMWGGFLAIGAVFALRRRTK